MPQKRAFYLPSKLQVLSQVSSATPGEQATNSAQTLPEKSASSAQQVLEKCTYLKQAWGYYRGYRPPWGYHLRVYQGYYPYPQQPYGFQPQFQGY
jgi:hypothetical protein